MRKYSFINDVYADPSLFVSEPIIAKDEILKTCCDTKNESVATTPNPYKHYTAFIDPTGIKFQNNAISDFENELTVIWERLNSLQRRTPEFVELSCKNCGAKIHQKYEDQIIKCPYCKTVYAVGYKQVNSV